MNKIKVHIIITALAMLLFLPGLGVTPLFDWDELNFAESAREMNLSNNWYYVQVAFEPFWEKPPLFIWIQAFFVSLFGEHTWVFRLPNALAGIVTVNLAYHIGCYLEKRALGVFWALAMAFTFAPMLYFKLGIIDRDGKKIKDPVSQQEFNAYSLLQRFVLKVQRALSRSPDRNSKRLLTFAAAMAI